MGSLGPFVTLRYTMGSLWSNFSHLLKYFAVSSPWEVFFMITHQLFPIMLGDWDNNTEEKNCLEEWFNSEINHHHFESVFSSLHTVENSKFHNDKEKKWTENNASQLLGDSEDELAGEHSSTVSNNDGEVDCMSKISDQESSGGRVLGDLSETQESMSKHYIHKDKKVWYFHLVSHSTGRASSHTFATRIWAILFCYKDVWQFWPGGSVG